MKLNITRHDLNIIIDLVRKFRYALESIDSYEGDEHVILELKKRELDDLLDRLFEYDDDQIFIRF